MTSESLGRGECPQCEKKKKKETVETSEPQKKIQGPLTQWMRS